MGSLFSQKETGFENIIPISFSLCYFSWCGVVLMTIMAKDTE